MNNRLPPGVLLGELIGTFVLCLVVKSTATAAVLGKTIAGQPPDSSSVFLAIALTLVVIALVYGSCHFNPGLTLGAACAKQISWGEVGPRILAQLGGALLASIAIWCVYGSAGYNKAHLGASLPVPGFNLVQVMVVEFLAALVFYFLVLRLVAHPTLMDGFKAIGIGFALGIMVLWAGPISGGAVNPAIGIAPMLVSLTFTGWYIYLFAPFLAGLVAGVLNRRYTKENDDRPSYARS